MFATVVATAKATMEFVFEYTLEISATVGLQARIDGVLPRRL